ncbi:hypothetical protein LINPERHAP2_LOCUS8482, partial [Linum perenne]
MPRKKYRKNSTHLSRNAFTLYPSWLQQQYSLCCPCRLLCTSATTAMAKERRSRYNQYNLQVTSS